MNLIQTIILSIVEGITEFLPISSTGHLILVSKLLSINPTNFTKSFEIAIQLGAIASVAVLYAQKILTNKKLIPILLVAFIPTGIVGIIAYPLIKKVFLESTTITLVSLFIGGIAIILIEKFYKPKNLTKSVTEITYKNAFLIGLAQSISVIPGVSRAAATIFGGIFVHLTREAAIEFSFLLAVPTMLAATALDIVKSRSEFSSADFMQIGLGFVVSFLVALAAVKFLIKFIKQNDFTSFGVYRIIIALLGFLFLLK